MIKDKQEIKDDKNVKEERVGDSRRIFIMSAAALGVVVASAGVSKILVSASSDTLRRRANRSYANDDLQQERVMSQKQLVLMADNEKKQMLNEILHNYHSAD